MGYVVKEENAQAGEVTRRGPFVTEQEARMALGNLVEQAYDFNPQLATANVRQEVENAVRMGARIVATPRAISFAATRLNLRGTPRPASQVWRKVPEHRQDEASCPRRLTWEYYAEMMETRRRALCFSISASGRKSWSVL